jgi:hypothetical protein
MFGCLSAERKITQDPVEKESPSQSEQSIARRGEVSLQGKIARQPYALNTQGIGADLSNLVLQGALNKMEKSIDSLPKYRYFR